MMAGFVFSPRTILSKWSATWPTVFPAKTSGCAFALGDRLGVVRPAGRERGEAGLLETPPPTDPNCSGAARDRERTRPAGVPSRFARSTCCISCSVIVDGVCALSNDLVLMTVFPFTRLDVHGVRVGWSWSLLLSFSPLQRQRPSGARRVGIRGPRAGASPYTSRNRRGHLRQGARPPPMPAVRCPRRQKFAAGIQPSTRPTLNTCPARGSAPRKQLVLFDTLGARKEDVPLADRSRRLGRETRRGHGPGLIPVVAPRLRFPSPLAGCRRTCRHRSPMPWCDPDRRRARAAPGCGCGRSSTCSAQRSVGLTERRKECESSPG